MTLSVNTLDGKTTRIEGQAALQALHQLVSGQSPIIMAATGDKIVNYIFRSQVATFTTSD